MRKKDNKARGIVKGTPSAVLLSLAIHAGLFLLAGLFVVFTVLDKPEPKFTSPPAVERPKMKLKKPQVRLKKTSKPKQTSKIVTKLNMANMPEIQLPEMLGVGDGLAGGMGSSGFDMMPELEEVTTFGSGQSLGNDFVGTFYDLKRDRGGTTIPHDHLSFINTIKNFIIKGWSTAELSRFYQAPNKLYTTTFAMPPDLSLMAPTAFGVGEMSIGYLWAIHYKGELVYPEDIKFRFWGAADDIMFVRVAGKLVLQANNEWGNEIASLQVLWDNASSDSGKYPIGNVMAWVGEWITLEAGKPLPMEVLIAELPGGNFQAMLCVEVEGVEYPKNPTRGGPRLPVFRTDQLPLDLIEAIQSRLDPGDANVAFGPVFNDYYSGEQATGTEDENAIYDTLNAAIGEPEQRIEDDPVRVWTYAGSKTLEAELVVAIGDQVHLKDKNGKQIKVPKDQLCATDIEYLHLSRPPPFSIEFKTNRRQLQAPEQPPDTWYRPITLFGYEFGASIKQKNTVDYPYELTMVYFAYGNEVSGNNYVLLDRRESTFSLNKENGRCFEFKGGLVKTREHAILPDTPMHGVRYGGFLITLADKTGRIVEHKASREFLFDHLHALKKLKVGNHFDEECKRVGVPRPGEADRSWNN